MPKVILDHSNDYEEWVRRHKNGTLFVSSGNSNAALTAACEQIANIDWLAVLMRHKERLEREAQMRGYEEMAAREAAEIAYRLAHMNESYPNSTEDDEE